MPATLNFGPITEAAHTANLGGYLGKATPRYMGALPTYEFERGMVVVEESGAVAYPDYSKFPPPAGIIEAAFAQGRPVRARWAVTGHLSYCVPQEFLVYDQDEDGNSYEPWIDWEKLLAQPDGEYLLATWSDSSGYSPRFSGSDEQWLVIRDGDFRMVNCQRAGGTVATWGYRSPYEAGKTKEDRWSVLDSFPSIPEGSA